MKRQNYSIQKSNNVSRLIDQCTVVNGKMILSTQPDIKNSNSKVGDSKVPHKKTVAHKDGISKKMATNLKYSTKPNKNRRNKKRHRNALSNSTPVASYIYKNMRPTSITAPKQVGTSSEFRSTKVTTKTNSCNLRYDIPKSSIEGRTVILNGVLCTVEIIDYGLMDRN